MPSVNPEILRWARESAGMSLHAAASKLSLGDTKKALGKDRLQSLETGQDEPEVAMLMKMAKAYRRPLLSFYLPEPPAPDTSAHDFRTLPQRNSADEPVVATLLRDVKTRQTLVRAMLEEEDSAARLYVGSVSTKSSVDEVRSSIVEAAGISLNEFRAAKNQDAAFAYLREKLEGIGIFVLLLGNLGTFHTNIDVTAFRGIALADPIAPFVVINDQDAKSAWSFTLLHEACHLWLGESAISSFGSDIASEKFCNDVASSFLLPHADLATLPLPEPGDLAEIAAAIAEFSFKRNLSMTMVAFRLFQSQRVSEEVWTRLSNTFREEWRKAKEKEKEFRKSKENASGPSYYLVKRHRLGKALVDTTYRGVMEGTLSATKAAKILGVAPRGVYPLLNTANGRAA